MPVGYTPQNGGECSAALGGSGDEVGIESIGGCTIYNDLTSTTFTVSKVFSDTNTSTVSVSLVCTGGPVEGVAVGRRAQTRRRSSRSPGSTRPTRGRAPRPRPRCRRGTRRTDGGTCTDDLAGETGGECTITNDLNTATFTVTRYFSDGNDGRRADQRRRARRRTGQVVGSGNLRGAEGSPRSSASAGSAPKADTTCIATETTIPPGYTASGDPEGTCSATLAVGSCTITNTLNSAVFSVAKDFSDGQHRATVTVHLTCTDGERQPGLAERVRGLSGEVHGAGLRSRPGASVSCDATEDPVPGYTGSDGGSCQANLEGEGGGAARSPTRRRRCRGPRRDLHRREGLQRQQPATRVTVRVSCTAPATVTRRSNPVAEGSPSTVDRA